jgi:hypothetical protein
VKERIELTDTPMSAIIKLCEGNPGALEVCCELFKTGSQTDPDAALEGLAPLLDLDTLGIYGSKIWMLFKDVCGEDIVKTHACLRGHQLGFLSGGDLRSAIQGDGKVDTDDLLAKVRARLPNFGHLMPADRTDHQ